MKSFKTFLIEENDNGYVIHLNWKSSISGNATLMVPKKDFDKDQDKASLDILKHKIHNAKVLTKLKQDPKPIVKVKNSKTSEFYMVEVEFLTKIIEEDIKQPTNVDKTRDRQEREKEQLKVKQTRELEKAREQDFKKKEQDRKVKERQKQLEKQTKKQENTQLDFGKESENIFEYLEDGTLELVKSYKKSLQ
jgi:hypothetical protein